MIHLGDHEYTPLIGRPRRIDPATAEILAQVDHTPGTGWECAVCDQPWPCHPARVQLTEAYRDDPIGLAVLLGAALTDACAELRDVPADELYERFVAWTRYRPERS